MTVKQKAIEAEGALRNRLVAICERAFVAEEFWFNRDSAKSQRQLGECYALLRAGCVFELRHDMSGQPDDGTIWVRIWSQGFAHFDWGGGLDEETYYLPDEDRLDRADGKDWY